MTMGEGLRLIGGERKPKAKETQRRQHLIQRNHRPIRPGNNP